MSTTTRVFSELGISSLGSENFENVARSAIGHRLLLNEVKEHATHVERASANSVSASIRENSQRLSKPMYAKDIYLWSFLIFSFLTVSDFILVRGVLDLVLVRNHLKIYVFL